jgi:RND superfamily putative drug exporter
MQPKGIAARAAHWSAAHRKTAIFGWLAFVVVAFIIGGAVGTKNIADEDMGNGTSKVAEQNIARADFPEKSDEQVLVQGKGDTRVGDPAFTAGVNDVTARL